MPKRSGTADSIKNFAALHLNNGKVYPSAEWNQSNILGTAASGPSINTPIFVHIQDDNTNM